MPEFGRSTGVPAARSNIVLRECSKARKISWLKMNAADWYWQAKVTLSGRAFGSREGLLRCRLRGGVFFGGD